jgi:hypothetical protein
VLWQQLPGWQASAPPVWGQQKSDGFDPFVTGLNAQTAGEGAHVFGTQVPPTVLQANVDPYPGSDWHWVSFAQGPQVCGVWMPQICPLQFVSVRQFPGTHAPLMHR